MPFLLTLFVLLLSTSAHAQTPTFPVRLEVAAQQKEGNVLNPAVHRFELSCYAGSCELTILTLNQCMNLSNGNASNPKIQQYSSKAKDLTVNAEENALLVTVRGENLGEFTMQLRFEYRITSQKRRAVQSYDLTGFTGAYTKISAVTDKPVGAEYIPLRGDFVNFTMTCPVSLKGVPN